MPWHVQLLGSLGWPWQSRWRWQGYHVQAQNQSPIITNKVQKQKDLPKTWVLTGKQFEDAREKKNRTIILDLSKTLVGHQGPKAIKRISPSKTLRNKANKTWKMSFKSKLLEFCKTRAKKSRPDMLSFYVVLAGHDKVSDAGRAPTCRRKLKAPSLQTKNTNNERPSEIRSFNGKTVWRFQTEKEQNLYSRPFKSPAGHEDPKAIKGISPS